MILTHSGRTSRERFSALCVHSIMPSSVIHIFAYSYERTLISVQFGLVMDDDGIAEPGHKLASFAVDEDVIQSRLAEVEPGDEP